MSQKLLSVIIADDDRLVLKDLTHLVDWKSLGFQIKSTAVSGEQALGLVHKYKPDLLITDIRMMGMDGLTLIEETHRLYPETKFLIISAYHEFDYARRAMANGVSDYILKTEITAPSLMQKLLSIRDLCFSSSANLETLRLQELQKFYSSDAFTLPDKKDMSSDPYSHIRELADEKYYFLILGSVQKLAKDINYAINQMGIHNRAAASAFYQVAKEHCARPIYCIYNNKLILGVSSDIALFNKRSAIRELISHFQFCVSSDSDPYAYFCSEKKMGFEEFKKLAADTDILIMYHMVFPAEKPLSIQELSLLHYIPSSHAFPFHSLVFDEEHEEKDVFLIKEYISTCYQNYDIFSIESFYQHFCTLMEVNSNNALIPGDSLFAPSLEHFLKWCFNTLHQCILIRTKGSQQSFGPSVENAIQYIHQNYSNGELNAADIAASAGLSSNRLGVLFKKETGYTVNEYLNQYRVKRAVELLKKTNLKIYEISEKCGYKSSQYFSQIIFQKTGKHPIDYRRVNKQ